jgi:hypothetical protein
VQLCAGTVPVVGTVTASVPDDLAKVLSLAVERGLAAEDDRVVALMCGSQGEDMVLQSFVVPGKGQTFSQLPQGGFHSPVASFCLTTAISRCLTLSLVYGTMSATPETLTAAPRWD